MALCSGSMCHKCSENIEVAEFLFVKLLFCYSYGILQLPTNGVESVDIFNERTKEDLQSMKTFVSQK